MPSDFLLQRKCNLYAGSFGSIIDLEETEMLL